MKNEKRNRRYSAQRRGLKSSTGDARIRWVFSWTPQNKGNWWPGYLRKSEVGCADK